MTDKLNYGMATVSVWILVFASSAARGDTCGQLAGVKGAGVEILRLQRGRGTGERVRYAMKIEEKKVAPLECDDVVLTGRDSSARVILSGAKLSVGPETRFEIAAYRGAGSASPQVSLLSLTYGKMRALVHRAGKSGAGDGGPNASAGPKGAATKAGGANSPAGAAKAGAPEEAASFRIRTYSAVVGVRGTDFYTSYDPNSGLTEQATIDGAVEVQQAGTAQKVLVNGGQQVSVETTPAAAKAAEAIMQAEGGEPMESPRQAPDVVGAGGAARPLKVVPIQDSVRNEIRRVSAVVKDDKDFAHTRAVQTLGRPQTWVLEREKVPEKFEGMKNEF